MLPPSVRLISGPGALFVLPEHRYRFRHCLIQAKGVIISIFGDMMRVPGIHLKLAERESRRRRYPNHHLFHRSLRIAGEPGEGGRLFAIGFETTSPTIAVALLQSKRQNIRNLYFLNSQKRIPSTIRTLLQSEKVRIDGFILPGHVSAIIGASPTSSSPMNSAFLL